MKWVFLVLLLAVFGFILYCGLQVMAGGRLHD